MQCLIDVSGLSASAQEQACHLADRLGWELTFLPNTPYIIVDFQNRDQALFEFTCGSLIEDDDYIYSEQDADR